MGSAASVLRPHSLALLSCTTSARHGQCLFYWMGKAIHSPHPSTCRSLCCHSHPVVAVTVECYNNEVRFLIVYVLLGVRYGDLTVSCDICFKLLSSFYSSGTFSSTPILLSELPCLGGGSVIASSQKFHFHLFDPDETWQL